jgi:tetrapyrrole methylase family protein/MazG family protein
VPPRKLKNKRKTNPPRRPEPGKPKSARRHAPRTKRAARKAKRKPIGDLFEALVNVQARLRAPGGCPWDRQQTHATLKTYLIEEAYEVLDALEKGDPRELAEELGDLLLQILFHADLALEAGTFDISDVVTGIHDKMIRRHPHVFGDVKADTAGEVLKNWARLKAQEKQAASAGNAVAKPLAPSALDGVPRSLPALLEAYQLTRRAAQVGFDWETVDGIFAKMQEETSELQAALDTSKKPEGKTGIREHAEEEIGDILFVAVNLARFLGFDPEVALKKSNLKFKSRFQLMENEAVQCGQRLAQFSKEELEVLWEAAKARFKTADGNGKAS